MTKRKLLFIVFTNEPCKRNHAFMHALDLTETGHQVRIILEGDGTRCLAERKGRFGELFNAASDRGIMAGACKTASAGCSTDDPARNMTAIAAEQSLPLLDEMDGHAGISTYVAEGFELVMY
jgi:hypothetical protein